MSFATDQEQWCAMHNQAEQLTPGCIVCPECWHVFKDAADVIATELDQWPDLWGDAIPTITDVLSCPLCTHDW